MMSRDKLLTLRKRVKAGEALDREQALAVIDHGIAAYVEMEGGASAVERRRELAERERQLMLALADARAAVPMQLDRALTREEQKVAYILDAAIDMLKAKGPAWKREWAWYAPSVDEEFS